MTVQIGDIYWIPANKSVDKRSTDTQIVITKVGTKFIYGKKINTDQEYKFTKKIDNTLLSTDNIARGIAYPDTIWEKQKAIRELNDITQKFKTRFLKIDDETNLTEYQQYLEEMQKLVQGINHE